MVALEAKLISISFSHICQILKSKKLSFEIDWINLNQVAEYWGVGYLQRIINSII
jgi:hypothetical protein